MVFFLSISNRIDGFIFCGYIPALFDLLNYSLAWGCCFYFLFIWIFRFFATFKCVNFSTVLTGCRWIYLRFLCYSIQFVMVSLRHCTWYSKQLSYTLPGDSYFVIHISLDCVSEQMSAPVEQIRQKLHGLNCSMVLCWQQRCVEQKKPK